MSQGNCAIPKKKHNIGTANYIFNKVGKGRTNSNTDIRSIISLLENRKKDPYYREKLLRLKIPNSCSSNIIHELTQCISDFQTSIQGRNKADGIVSPSGSTILYLGGVRFIGKHIIVDLDDQNLYAYDGKKKIHEFHCASGDKKHPTAIKPSLHHIFRKHQKYRSRTYNAKILFNWSPMNTPIFVDMA